MSIMNTYRQERLERLEAKLLNFRESAIRYKQLPETPEILEIINIYEYFNVELAEVIEHQREMVRKEQLNDNNNY